jgi:IS1 family transposase
MIIAKAGGLSEHYSFETAKVGKDLTFYIEGLNATIKARVSRLVRKSLSFSKLDKWHTLAIGWFFWQFNLERLQHYI